MQLFEANVETKESNEQCSCETAKTVVRQQIWREVMDDMLTMEEGNVNRDKVDLEISEIGSLGDRV